ncbi:MAG: cytochrome c family protein [Desulfobulbaceae bacterium]|nr:cytochrome c family protein [Desulfobulbaceae bacterium]
MKSPSAVNLHITTLPLLIISMFFMVSVAPCPAAKEPPPALSVYVGSLSCQPCHEKEYANFSIYAKKSNSYRSIERLQKGLNEQNLKKCYFCHTTGYGKPGGFISVEKTPLLKNAGCEVCHGPGSIHIEDAKPESIIGHPTIQICDQCHTSEMIKAFKFRPLIHGGGH